MSFQMTCSRSSICSIVPTTVFSSHHDSVSVPDYPLRDAACRSVDALLGHAPLLIEEGSLHDDFIGCETTQGSPQSEMIGWDMELSQTATRCSPLTSCFDMTEHEPLSGRSINASHPHEDLSDSHITHSTPVISSQTVSSALPPKTIPQSSTRQQSRPLYRFHQRRILLFRPRKLPLPVAHRTARHPRRRHHAPSTETGTSSP